MNDVIIKQIHKLGEDERGITYDFQTKKTGDFLFLMRRAGSISGNSYHEGKNAGTNPKILIILSGSVEFRYRRVGSDSMKSISVSEPSIIEVQPYVIHAVYAVTDFTMLEANSIEDIRQDRIREDVL